MYIDINDHKTCKHLSNNIPVPRVYEILYRNQEKYTVTNTYILCSYSKLSQRSKDEIERLFIAHNNDDNNCNTDNSKHS